MIFQKPSTRTRISFESGILQLGGNAIYLGANDIQLSRGETIEDTARALSLYTDCIVARFYDHADIEKLAVADFCSCYKWSFWDFPSLPDTRRSTNSL